MTETFVQWWAGRSQRERALLLVMLALALPILAWLLILRPIDLALDTARANHWAATTRLIQVRSDAGLLESTASVANETAQAIAARSASAAGFVPSRLDPTPDGKAMLTLPSAKPAALARWLQALDREGVFVETMTVRPNSDSTVAVEAVLRPRRG